MPILPDLSITAYHSSAPQWLSKTSLNAYRKHGPRWWKLRYLDRTVSEPAPDGSLQGSALDCLLTEGNGALARKFPVLPDDAPKRPSKTQLNAKKPSPDTMAAIAWWQDWEREYPDAEIMSDDDHVILHELADNIRLLPIWPDIERAKAQQTLRRHSENLGLGLQSRPDWLECERGLYWDLKKTRDISRFGVQAIDIGHHLQAAVAGWCLAGEGILMERARLVVGEWARGGRVNWFKIPDEALVAGDRLMRETASEIARRIRDNDWQDIQTEEQELPIPGWLMAKLEAQG